LQHLPTKKFLKKNFCHFVNFLEAPFKNYSLQTDQKHGICQKKDSFLKMLIILNVGNLLFHRGFFCSSQVSNLKIIRIKTIKNLRIQEKNNKLYDSFYESFFLQRIFFDFADVFSKSSSKNKERHTSQKHANWKNKANKLRQYFVDFKKKAINFFQKTFFFTKNFRDFLYVSSTQ